MANKVKFGLKNVHIAPIDNETGAYGTPFALEGAVNLSFDAEGDSSDFYADNTKYYTKYANSGYTGSLEVAKINESFYTEIMGYTKDSNGGIMETINAVDKYFALMYEVDGDSSQSRYVFFRCKASRPSSEAETTSDTVEPKTDTLELTASADSNGDVKYFIEKSSSNETFYNSFFTSVAGKKSI